MKYDEIEYSDRVYRGVEKLNPFLRGEFGFRAGVPFVRPELF
jgi:hypothetical protein